VNCELTQTVLHGYLDGELDAARAADFERHLISCSDCVAALEANENLRSSLQGARLYERAPEALRQKVQAQLGAATGPSVMPIRNPAPWRWLAVAATFLLAVILGWRVLPLLRDHAGFRHRGCAFAFPAAWPSRRCAVHRSAHRKTVVRWQAGLRSARPRFCE
jgi:mycothiol system anti-sigma-R factor